MLGPVESTLTVSSPEASRLEDTFAARSFTFQRSFNGRISWVLPSAINKSSFCELHPRRLCSRPHLENIAARILPRILSSVSRSKSLPRLLARAYWQKVNFRGSCNSEGFPVIRRVFSVLIKITVSINETSAPEKLISIARRCKAVVSTRHEYLLSLFS